jgi:hypothetical protein
MRTCGFHFLFDQSYPVVVWSLATFLLANQTIKTSLFQSARSFSFRKSVSTFVQPASYPQEKEVTP